MGRQVTRRPIMEARAFVELSNLCWNYPVSYTVVPGQASPMSFGWLPELVDRGFARLNTTDGNFYPTRKGLIAYNREAQRRDSARGNP